MIIKFLDRLVIISFLFLSIIFGIQAAISKDLMYGLLTMSTLAVAVLNEILFFLKYKEWITR